MNTYLELILEQLPNVVKRIRRTSEMDADWVHDTVTGLTEMAGDKLLDCSKDDRLSIARKAMEQAETRAS